MICTIYIIRNKENTKLQLHTQEIQPVVQLDDLDQIPNFMTVFQPKYHIYIA